MLYEVITELMQFGHLQQGIVRLAQQRIGMAQQYLSFLV